MLAVSAAPQNSVQEQKHTAPSGLQLPFRDVRVLNIQGRTHISTCHTIWVAAITKVHALYMLCLYVCMYVCTVCMYMVYTYQTAPIYVQYRTTHYVLLCVI